MGTERQPSTPQRSARAGGNHLNQRAVAWQGLVAGHRVLAGQQVTDAAQPGFAAGAEGRLRLDQKALAWHPSGDRASLAEIARHDSAAIVLRDRCRQGGFALVAGAAHQVRAQRQCATHQGKARGQQVVATRCQARAGQGDHNLPSLPGCIQPPVKGQCVGVPVVRQHCVQVGVEKVVAAATDTREEFPRLHVATATPVYFGARSSVHRCSAQCHPFGPRQCSRGFAGGQQPARQIVGLAKELQGPAARHRGQAVVAQAQHTPGLQVDSAKRLAQDAALVNLRCADRERAESRQRRCRQRCSGGSAHHKAAARVCQAGGRQASERETGARRCVHLAGAQLQRTREVEIAYGCLGPEHRGAQGRAQQPDFTGTLCGSIELHLRKTLQRRVANHLYQWCLQRQPGGAVGRGVSGSQRVCGRAAAGRQGVVAERYCAGGQRHGAAGARGHHRCIQADAEAFGQREVGIEHHPVSGCQPHAVKTCTLQQCGRGVANAIAQRCVQVGTGLPAAKQVGAGAYQHLARGRCGYRVRVASGARRHTARTQRKIDTPAIGQGLA